jgi:hypothetical protein
MNPDSGAVLTIDELSSYLKVSKSTLYKRTSTTSSPIGGGPGVTFGDTTGQGGHFGYEDPILVLLEQNTELHLDHRASRLQGSYHRICGAAPGCQETS